MEQYIIALDEGTTSCRAVAFNREGCTVAMRSRQFRQIYPQSGWVEHDAMEIWNAQLNALKELIRDLDLSPAQIAAIGIADQRETVVLWDKHTGKPVYNAIVWQCRRTAPLCDDLKQSGITEVVHKKTGLVIDAYFSATKIRWIMDNIPGVKEAAANGNILAGTIDTWLLWNLTGGKAHATDYSNASRTMLYNINELCWDEDILNMLDIPQAILPEVKPSSCTFGYTDPSILGASIPIAGIAGDQQAALFGQLCLQPGMIKNTYGTGCFILMNTGDKPIYSSNNLLTTIAWGIDGKVEYALEGSVFSAGASVQWLRDGLKIIDNAAQSQQYAEAVADNGGVYVVPAFTGLGAPYWDMYARGLIIGISRGTQRQHIVRATLESIAYQTMDILDTMQRDATLPFKNLRVDGGACANDFLMQFQADILGIEVERPPIVETTALGAAYLAGLEVGYWNKDALNAVWIPSKVFKPQMSDEQRFQLSQRWHEAVKRALSWAR
ncbi:glycerol kinase GlpK [Mahella australiensis]|uniref:Glycerol kinase n=1 Tax=Mahella australiensis (strain DSM 15567 / CIP 107919 / 50-1 BON) TaxID=697281 RepID=F3ZW95_MAHA5|nr:glycerol kinase GlpK [Mahella australiensis]AEE97504.1 glycerol kinase [Mahella australiensis 50-1 BON]